MADNLLSNPSTGPELLVRLRDIARLLHQSGSIDAQSQRGLAELVEDIAAALENKDLPPAELSHLAETTAHLEETLHHHQDQGVTARAREGLERIVESAEANAPLAVGLARRWLDVLANIGI